EDKCCAIGGRDTSATIVPYTTLFRSGPAAPSDCRAPHAQWRRGRHPRLHGPRTDRRRGTGWPGGPLRPRLCAVSAHSRGRRGPRSEEHTSELQSRSELVCRLLLEKKK